METRRSLAVRLALLVRRQPRFGDRQDLLLKDLTKKMLEAASVPQLPSQSCNPSSDQTYHNNPGYEVSMLFNALKPRNSTPDVQVRENAVRNLEAAKDEQQWPAGI
jgi:hypothetical protein